MVFKALGDIKVKAEVKPTVDNIMCRLHYRYTYIKYMAFVLLCTLYDAIGESSKSVLFARFSYTTIDFRCTSFYLIHLISRWFSRIFFPTSMHSSFFLTAILWFLCTPFVHRQAPLPTSVSSSIISFISPLRRLSSPILIITTPFPPQIIRKPVITHVQRDRITFTTMTGCWKMAGQAEKALTIAVLDK